VVLGSWLGPSWTGLEIVTAVPWQMMEHLHFGGKLGA
jgi:hypothetical protein